MDQHLKVNNLGNQASFTDETGDTVEIGFWSNGVTIISIGKQSVEIPNKVSHEIRDFFNRRFKG